MVHVCGKHMPVLALITTLYALYRSELLDVMCCVTLGYLVVDSLPLLLPGMLSHDPDSTEYHGFHMLIAVGTLPHATTP